MAQPQLAEEDLSQLLGGVDVERLPRHGIDGLLPLRDAGGQGVAEGGQGLPVHPAAGLLHLRQHPAEGQLRGLVQLPQVVLLQPGLQKLVKGGNGRRLSGQVSLPPGPVPFGAVQILQGELTVLFRVGGAADLEAAILDRQSVQVVAPGGGVQKIGGKRRVEHPSLRLDAVSEQGALEVLDVVSRFGDGGVEETPQGLGMASGKVLPVQHIGPTAVLRLLVQDHQVQIPRRADIDGPALPYQSLSRLGDGGHIRQFLHGASTCKGLFLHSLFRQLQAEPVDEPGEFQPHKERVRPLARILNQVVLRPKLQRRIGDDGGKPPGVAGALLPLRELPHHAGLSRGLRRRQHVGQRPVQRVDAAVHLHKAHGGLFPHAAHAGDIVRGVSHEGLQVNHVDGIEAILLPEGLRRHVLGGGLTHASGDQLDLGAVRDELEAVLVPRHHHALPVRRLAFAGDGAQKVVRLPARQLIAGDVQRVQHLLQDRHLHAQLLRHGLAGGLIGGVRSVAKGGGVHVEGDAHRVRLLLPLQAQERGQKAEDGVGIQPLPIGQGPDPVIGAVDDAVAVDGHELHGQFLPGDK